jgi:uncharacterized protein YccT (UPF0319 family)
MNKNEIPILNINNNSSRLFIESDPIINNVYILLNDLALQLSNIKDPNDYYYFISEWNYAISITKEQLMADGNIMDYNYINELNKYNYNHNQNCLINEMKEIIKESEKKLKGLKLITDSEVGVIIIHEFILDLLGRGIYIYLY